MRQKFYICRHCGNIIAMVEDKGVPVVCCGENMEKLVPNSVEASPEKHIPVYERKGNIVTVRVGEIEHPMHDKHFIQWVSLQTKQGNQRKLLKPDIEPKVSFALCEGDEVEAVYAYCNMHGLWKVK